ncbi:hypothetical protein OIU76_029377 [Salix suchowensis]|nr:hypothetical protein OIU76_029377 [Salix suchowensis]
MGEQLKFDAKIVPSSLHYIHFKVNDGGESQALHCDLSQILNPKDKLKRERLEQIKHLAHSISSPRMVLCDFNEILSESEKVGGVPADARRCLRFGNRVQDCGLMDSKSLGPKST